MRDRHHSKLVEIQCGQYHAAIYADNEMTSTTTTTKARPCKMVGYLTQQTWIKSSKALLTEHHPDWENDPGFIIHCIKFYSFGAEQCVVPDSPFQQSKA